MKKLFFTLLTSISLFSFAQAPQEISYQGVARSTSGTVLPNQNIGIKLDLHQGSAAGTIVFSESHNKTTNAFGLFTLGIGSSNTSGFTSINWANGPYFLEVSMDPAGGTSYSSVGTQQFMSVPYALYAQTAGNASATPTIIINAPNTVTSAGGSYTINIPASITYTAGNGIDITGGVISNTAIAVTPTIAAGNNITINPSTPSNSYTVNAPSYSLSQTGNNINLLQNGTSIGTATLPVVTSYSAGNGIDITGGVISNTMTATPPTINSGGVANVTNPSTNVYLVDVPAPNLNFNTGTNVLTLTQNGATTTATLNGSGSNTVSIIGSGIAAVSPTTGSNFTVSVPSPTYTSNGPTTISGSYPNYTVNSVTSPTTSLVAGNTNIQLIPGTNSYTLNAYTYSLTNNSNTLTLTNGAPLGYTSTVVLPTASTTTVSSGSNVNVTGSGASYTVSAPSYSLTSNSNTLTLSNGTAITTATVPATVITGTGTGIASVTASANSFTVNVPSPTYTPSTGSLAFGSTVINVAPTLSLTGSTLTSGAATNSVNLATIPGLWTSPTATTVATTNSTSLVGIGTNTPTYKLDVYGTASVPATIHGYNSGATASSTGVFGENPNNGIGVYGQSNSGVGVWGKSTTGAGIYGESTSGDGGKFILSSNTTTANAVNAQTNGTGVAIYAKSFNATPLAAKFEGGTEIFHTATVANPHLNISSPSAVYGRVKYSNIGQANYFSTEYINDGSGINEAFSINQFNGTNSKPVFLINGQRMAYVNALNYPLYTFHVMTSTATAQGGISSEGFAQAGQINLVRNNNAGAGVRSAAIFGDDLGKINFAGYDGSAFGDGAKIYAKAVENITGSNKGTELIFAAVPTGTNTNKDVFKINGTNKLEILTSLFIPTNAGASKVLTSDAAGNASWQAITAPALAWMSSAGTTTLVNNTDKVGIGTNTPSESLDVNGNINIPVSTSSVGVIKMAGTRFISAPGTDNLFVGKLSGNIATSGFNNVAFGNNTLQNLSSGANNVGIGYQVMQVLGSGSQNIAIGTNALSSINIGNNNTALGFQAGNVITSGSNNLFLGYNANANLATLTNASAIGYLARVDASNSMVLGSINGINGATASAKVGIGTTTPQSALEVATDGSLDKGLRVSNANSTTNGPSIYLDGQNQDWSITGSNAGNGSGANKFVIRDYSNAVDRFVIDNTGNVGIGTTAPINKFHVNGSVAITDGTQGLGKVLVSDASGNASWMPIMKITYGSAFCQSIASVSTTPVKFNTNLGSVVKTYSDTHLEVILQTDLNVFDLVGANSVTYEIKVNGISSNGNTGKAVYFVDNANAFNIINNKGVTITAEFDGLTAGSYNVELWAYCLSGNALNVYIDPGCFGASSVIIKEFK